MADPDRPGQLTVRLAQLLLVAAAAGLWVASRLPWVAIRSFDGLGQPKTTTLSGATWSTALLPLALLVLAAAVAAVAVRGWPLRALAVVVAAGSLAAGYLAISLWAVRDVAVRATDLAQVPLIWLVGSERHYVGAAITLAAAVCTLVGGVLLMRSAARADTTKYAPPAARRSMARRDDGGVSERTMWDAMDEGRDPTDQPPESAVPPDCQPGSQSDTEGR